MMGKKDMNSKLFYGVTLEKLVPENDFYRQVDKVIDLSFARKLCKKYYGTTGNPSIDPVVFFKIQLIGHLENIIYDRQLARVINDRLSLRRYLKYDLDEEAPVHSTISRTRQRIPKHIFEEVFIYILSECVKNGLVSGKLVAMDSTLIKANASLDSLRPKLSIQDMKEPEMTPGEYYEKTLKENPVDDSKVEEKPKRGSRIKRNKSHSYKKRNDRFYSSSDPDAKIATKGNKGKDLFYREHITVDTEKGIITDVLAKGADVHDNQIMVEALDRTMCNLARTDVSLEAFVADSAYRSSNELLEVEKRDVDPYISEKQPAYLKDKEFSKDNFVYDKKEDVFICPEGNKLKRWTSNVGDYAYRADKGVCNECPSKPRCTNSSTGRTINRWKRADILDDIRDRLNTPYGRCAMKLRKTVVEGTFGDVKTFKGLAKVNTKGLEGASKKFLTVSTAQNLKKLIKYMGRHLRRATQVLSVASLSKLQKSFIGIYYNLAQFSRFASIKFLLARTQSFSSSFHSKFSLN